MLAQQQRAAASKILSRIPFYFPASPHPALLTSAPRPLFHATCCLFLFCFFFPRYFVVLYLPPFFLSQDVIGKQSYEISLNWAHLSGHGTEDELALSSICHEKGEEVIAIRSLENGGNVMVLTQVVRRPAEGYEVRAKHFFKRVMDKSELRSNGREPRSNVVTVRRKKKC